VEAA
jgi:hypothetical protein